MAMTPGAIQPGKLSRELDEDREMWEQQSRESDPAYEAFLRYRGADVRRVIVTDDELKAHPEWEDVTERRREGSRRRQWSAQWSWRMRAQAYDRMMSRSDLAELARYRRGMNERHRALGQDILKKIAEWVKALDAGTLKPSEAAALIRAARELERDASGASLGAVAGLPDMLIDPDEDGAVEAPKDQTLGALMGVDSKTERELAEALHAVLGEIRTGEDQ